jgi:hypothetical protein
MAPVKRLVSPSLNAPGLMATAGAVYAATVMILNAYHGHGVIDPPVIIAAVGAVAALLTRQVVTPVADPVSAAGVPLVPAPTAVLPPVVSITPPPIPPATGSQL